MSFVCPTDCIQHCLQQQQFARMRALMLLPRRALWPSPNLGPSFGLGHICNYAFTPFIRVYWQLPACRFHIVGPRHDVTKICLINETISSTPWNDLLRGSHRWFFAGICEVIDGSWFLTLLNMNLADLLLSRVMSKRVFAMSSEELRSHLLIAAVFKQGESVSYVTLEICGGDTSLPNNPEAPTILKSLSRSSTMFMSEAHCTMQFIKQAEPFLHVDGLDNIVTGHFLCAQR